MDTKNIAETEELAKSGGAQGSGVNEVFSRVYCAVQKTLGVTPYAEQLGAAMALAGHNMVQMQTGEGKTLSTRRFPAVRR